MLQREPHRGKGGAVKAGLLAARGDYRFICDADLSMPVAELPRFLPPMLTGFDVAIGSREGHGARRIGEPIVRHLAGRAFNFARPAADGAAASNDTQCGFKMFTATRGRGDLSARARSTAGRSTSRCCYIARARGLRIVEVPIEWHYRRESRLSLLRDGARMFGELLSIRARARRGEYDR